MAEPAKTAPVIFRRAHDPDFPAILRLQSLNHIRNLNADELRWGFLSAEFSLEQIAAMAGDLGITIAAAGAEVAGFLCAFRGDFDHRSPVIAKMLEAYDRVQFAGRALAGFDSYIYGPVCIARECRGRGLLRGLYESQLRGLAGQFEIGVAFVSRDNPHSLAAHTHGLGMTEAGEFELGGKCYVILAFRVPPAIQD